MFDLNEKLDQVVDAVKEEVSTKIAEGDIDVSVENAKDVIVNAISNVAEESGIDLGAIRDKFTD